MAKIERKGKISASEEASIDAKANKKLGNKRKRDSSLRQFAKGVNKRFGA